MARLFLLPNLTETAPFRFVEGTYATHQNERRKPDTRDEDRTAQTSKNQKERQANKHMKAFLILAAITVVIGFAVLGTTRSTAYVHGGREVVQRKVDDAVPTEVKLEGLKSQVRKAEETAVEMEVDSAVTSGTANALARKRDELEREIAKLVSEVANGKSLLREKRETYTISGVGYTWQQLYSIVVKKAETLRGHREDLQHLEENHASTLRIAKIQKLRTGKLESRIAAEKRHITRLEQRHRHAKATAEVARKTAALNDQNDTFANNDYAEVLSSTERDVCRLEAANKRAFIGADIYGNEVDLRAVGASHNRDSLIDAIDRIADPGAPASEAGGVSGEPDPAGLLSE